MVLRTTAALGVFSVLDKGLAAARQVLMAILFGAGAAMDALVVAISVVEMLVSLLTGSFLSVFIPLYARWRPDQTEEAADARALNLVGVLMALLSAAALGLALWGGKVVDWVGYGFKESQQRLAESMMPWLAVFLWANGTVVLLTGLFHVRRQFLTPRIAQVAERVIVLVVLIGVAPILGIRAAPLALAMGALGLVLILGGGMVRQTGPVRIRLSPRAPEVRAYLFLVLPLLGGAAIDHVVLFTDRAMASSLAPGAVSALYYATVLWWLPAILLNNNFSTVFFPQLAADIASRDPRRLGRALQFAFKTMILLMLGATVLMVILAQDVTALLFQHGSFDAASRRLTAKTLMALSLCLMVKGVGSLISMTLFACQRTGVTAACGAIRVVLNVLFNALLMGPLGAVGIALSTTLTLGIWLGIVSFPFGRELSRRQVTVFRGGDFPMLCLKAVLAAGAAAGATLLVVEAPLLAGTATLATLLRLVMAGGVGTAAYIGTLYALRLPEAMEVARLVTARCGGGRGSA
ncbi:MAG: murein biosynthesis integral membrane protein MurJ [Acidobacteriota bacterium]